MKAKLHILAGLPEPRVHDLTTPAITIGRAADNIIQLNDRSVSKHHALIVVEDDEHRIIDLHATNGTFVNGHPVTVRTLKSGDQVHLGNFMFVYLPEVPAPVAAPPVPAAVAPEPPPPAPASAPVQPRIRTVAPAPAPAPVAATPPPPVKRSFVRLPGAEPITAPAAGSRTTGGIKPLVKRDTGATPPPAPPAPAAPVTEDKPLATPPAPADEQPLVQTAAAAQGEKQLLTGPRQPQDRVLGRPPGGGAGDRILKKPGAPANS